MGFHGRVRSFSWNFAGYLPFLGEMTGAAPACLASCRAAEDHMNFGNLLHWAVVFLIVAIVAAVLGFGGVAGTAMEGARILFWVALVLLLISLVFGFARRGRY
jgi:uncharacterized membrane protein YtjA (UPF0391 family)